EAADVVESYAKDHPIEEVYDDLLVPDLDSVKRDRGYEDVTPDDERFILNAVEEVADDVAASSGWSVGPADEQPGRRARLFGCSAQDTVDETALHLLAGALDNRRWAIEIGPPDLLISELLTQIEQADADLLFVRALAPGGLARTP